MVIDIKLTLTAYLTDGKFDYDFKIKKSTSLRSHPTTNTVITMQVVAIFVRALKLTYRLYTNTHPLPPPPKQF